MVADPAPLFFLKIKAKENPPPLMGGDKGEGELIVWCVTRSKNLRKSQNVTLRDIKPHWCGHLEEQRNAAIYIVPIYNKNET